MRNLPNFCLVAAVAVWFFKTAKASGKNPFLAFVLGAMSGCGGALFITGFFRVVGLPRLLNGLALTIGLTLCTLAGGAAVAASVRENLYGKVEPSVYEHLTAWLMIAATFVGPLLFWLS